MKNGKILTLAFGVLLAAAYYGCSSSSEKSEETGGYDIPASEVFGDEGSTVPAEEGSAEVAAPTLETPPTDMEDSSESLPAPDTAEAPVPEEAQVSEAQTSHTREEVVSDQSETLSSPDTASTPWAPEAWETKRFLNRQGVSPDKIFQGEVIFFRPGDHYNRQLTQIRQNNAHLSQAKRLVVGDHFRIPSGVSRVQYGRGNYRIQKGDTLQRIAHRLYGTNQRWVELYFLNPGLSHYDRLQVGDEIVFLDSTEVAHVESRTEEAVSAPTKSIPTIEELDEPAAAESNTQRVVNQPPAVVESTPPVQVQPTETPMQEPVAIQATPPAQVPRLPVKKIGLVNRLLKFLLVAALLGVLGWAIWKFYVQNRRRAQARAMSLTDEFETYSEQIATKESQFTPDPTDPNLHHDTEVTSSSDKTGSHRE